MKSRETIFGEAAKQAGRAENNFGDAHQGQYLPTSCPRQSNETGPRGVRFAQSRRLR